MSRIYVALDLETTGLDPDRDAIIEVGAVRFDLDGRCDTFRRFVDPNRPIPYRVERLTGITQSDVDGAPMFVEVAADVEAFIGDCPVVGQNVNFDLRFLERSRITPPGPAYDTQELAEILLPDLVEHNLAAIARHLGVDLADWHRALADAQTARLVFLALRERLAALPPALIAEAERVAASVDWPLRHLLLEVSQDAPAAFGSETSGLMHGAVRPPGKPGAPLTLAPDDAVQIDANDVERLLTAGAQDVVEDFEERPEQVAMARAVTGALNNNDQLLVEAGTGVGKSLAYLVPAARYAQENDTRVVISTNTINLQGQLVGQDIPAVQHLLTNGAGEANGLRAAQLKGRRNYLCLLRWSNLRQAATRSEEEAKLLVRLLLWLPHTETGDRGELRLSQGEDAAWGRLSAQNEACLATPCAYVRDGSCFLLRARKRAEAAHVLVVNHALTLSDVAVGGGVIPEYEHLIVDEAQHLESEATSQFGFHGDEDALVDLLDRTSSRGGGLTGSLRSAGRGLAGQLTTTRELLELAGRADDAVERAKARLPDFFLRLAGFVRQQSHGGGDYDERLLLTRAMRVQPDWAEVELAWENLSASLGEVLTVLERMHGGLETPEATNLLDHERLVTEAADLFQTGAELREGIGNIILSEDPNTICWITKQQRKGDVVSLSSAPLRVSGILQERLFSQKRSTVLTSATLTAEGKFDYVRGTLGLPEANELLLGSPFDYAESTRVLVPRDMPEPNQNGYMVALQQALIELARASRGRGLALFTSHASLRAAYRGIKETLEEQGILVLAHHIDGSPRQLTQALRNNPDTLVLGTASFWEGVDVVGEALSLLVMARLPFSVPDDPVFRARSELYDDPFSQYAVPQAALRFKQGFGRLIRRKTDRGVMVVLDGRITSKSYGESFLRSLPACGVERVLLREMPDMVAEWLAPRE